MKKLTYRQRQAKLKESRGYISVYKELNQKYTKRQVQSILKQRAKGGYNSYSRKFEVSKPLSKGTESKTIGYRGERDTPQKMTMADKGRKIVETISENLPNIKGMRRYSEKVAKNYERYQKIKTVRAIIKGDVNLAQDWEKYGKKLTRTEVLKMSPKEFIKYTKFRAKLTKSLVKAGVMTTKDRYKNLFIRSKWQKTIDELEKLLIDTPTGE